MSNTVFEVCYELGFEMGKTMTSAPYDKYKTAVKSLDGDQKEKALIEFYRGAEEGKSAKSGN